MRFASIHVVNVVIASPLPPPTVKASPWATINVSVGLHPSGPRLAKYIGQASSHSYTSKWESVRQHIENERALSAPMMCALKPIGGVRPTPLSSAQAPPTAPQIKGQQEHRSPHPRLRRQPRGTVAHQSTTVARRRAAAATLVRGERRAAPSVRVVGTATRHRRRAARAAAARARPLPAVHLPQDAMHDASRRPAMRGALAPGHGMMRCMQSDRRSIMRSLFGGISGWAAAAGMHACGAGSFLQLSCHPRRSFTHNTQTAACEITGNFRCFIVKAESRIPSAW